MPSSPSRLPAVPHQHRSAQGPARPADPVRSPSRAAGDAERTGRPRDTAEPAHRAPNSFTRPHHAPGNAERAHQTPDDTDQPHRTPETADPQHPVPDTADRPQQTPDDAGAAHRAPDRTDRTHNVPDTAAGPRRAPENAGTADRPRPAPANAAAADRAPDRAERTPRVPDVPGRRPRRATDRAGKRDAWADAAEAAPYRASDTGDRSLPAADTAEHPHRPPLPAGVLLPPGGERPGRLPGPLGPDRLASGAPPYRSATATAFELPARPAAVGTARRAVRDLLTAWDVPADRRDDAVLVTSELVTNALVHTAGERIACRVHGTADRIRIEVEDQGGGHAPPAARRPEPDDQHGRGLFLVDALSLDWGVAPVPGRPARVVWAELPSGLD
ncbi:ATP-binding protein [Streptomyces durhamensis]|uniref:ATP-binding protein n=1 Tax=Streptomyces durhamensis TaxID=68194 RepID=UPI001FD8375E|nr:ATP-binding protein [Streptomyces durhamensis]